MVKIFKYYFSYDINEWDTIDYFTFNYTNYFEKALQRNIWYIHGTITEGIIVGVDSMSQINYSNMNYSCIERIMVKPYINGMTRRYYIEELKRALLSVDFLVIYGVSFGETDYTWWKIIKEWLKKTNNHKIKS